MPHFKLHIGNRATDEIQKEPLEERTPLRKTHIKKKNNSTTEEQKKKKECVCYHTIKRFRESTNERTRPETNNELL